ncbi:hypothetical protein F7725_009607 [Dissostichus mawsoni]|uniref:Uncharacterized protein n=1 Tax=Dissostichus mawsoni TaxID=36200 RepID=A0A7J5XMQ0_DISMA|nr:hypothetical protein F7725_009607 [Dissostichus mawsoni]
MSNRYAAAGKDGQLSGDGTQSDPGGELLDKDGGKVGLGKKVTLLRGISIIIGIIIGAGIFISPKGILKHSGSIGMSLVVWIACGVLSLFGALSYAELGTCIKNYGGHLSGVRSVHPGAPVHALCGPPMAVKLATAIGIRETKNFENAFDMNNVKLSGMPLAFYSGMYAYAGWFYLNFVTEEVDNPERTVPLAICISMAITFAEKLMGNFSVVVPLFVALSCFGSMNGSLFALSRHLQPVELHEFLRWLFIGVVVLGLIYLRYTKPDLPRPFKVPLFIPVVFCLTCFFMVFLSLYSDPVNTGIGFAISLTGIPPTTSSFTLTIDQSGFRALDCFNRTLQILLVVVPAEE